VVGHNVSDDVSDEFGKHIRDVVAHLDACLAERIEPRSVLHGFIT